MVLEFDLPQSCEPRRCRFGFEKQGNTGVIMIDEGVVYRGNNPLFREFVGQGEFNYTTNEELNEFITELDVVTAEDIPLNNEAEQDCGGVEPVEAPACNPQPQIIREFDEEAFKATLAADIKGQDEAIETIALLMSAAIRKRQPTRPHVDLLAGDTGIGKTSFGEKLPEAINAATGANYGLIRIDLNQFSDRHYTARLWGSPPGYVGYDDPSVLDKLHENPYQVILLDEMEKADPYVMNALMNAMASGRMECSRIQTGCANEYDFSKAIMVFTTNIPLDVEDGVTQHEITLSSKRQLRAHRADGHHISPEIVNRFSEIIVFKPISDEVKHEIAGLSIKRLARQYELDVVHVNNELLTTFAERCIAEEGVREFEYMAERVFGVAMASYDLDANGRSVSIIGDIDAPVVAEADIEEALDD
jgi:ATP-dependent Clp protease ATP-binding subunit ClpA